MKKNFLRCIFVLFPLFTFAQSELTTSFRFGFMAGTNVASVGELDSKMCLRGGLLAQFPIANPQFFGEVAVSAEEKGGKIKDVNNISQLGIQMDAKFGYNIWGNEKVGLQAMIGPFFNYGLLSRTSTPYSDKPFDNYKGNEDARITMGAIVGARINFGRHWGLGMDYSYSFVNDRFRAFSLSAIFRF